jgi:hypothetical protein
MREELIKACGRLVEALGDPVNRPAVEEYARRALRNMGAGRSPEAREMARLDAMASEGKYS